VSIFRDHPSYLQRIKRQRAARWVGTKVAALINVRDTATGVEPLIVQTPAVRDTKTGADAAHRPNAAVRATATGVEPLIVYVAPVTKYIPHIYEDFV
jgi:hypothetical protein